MDKLTSVKVNLRGLLISSPLGMTIMALEKDYKEYIGEDIPFLNFGFNRLDLFLKSLKDTLTIFGTGMHAKVEAVTVKSNAHIKKMVSVQKNTKKRKFSNPYIQNNNVNRQPPKNKSKVNINPPRQRPMQSKPILQPKMAPKVPKAPKQNLNNQQNNFDQQSSFYNQNQRSAPRYHNSTNGHQQNHNYQNGYPQYVSQQYMNTQQYYGQQQNSYMRQQDNRTFLSNYQIQQLHNLNTVELMRMRQRIQSELYYLRIQNDRNCVDVRINFF